MTLPWSLKFFFGIISDTVPFFGTRRKSYLVLFNVNQFFALFAIYAFEFDDALVVTFFISWANFGQAFCDVVLNAMTIT